MNYCTLTVNVALSRVIRIHPLYKVKDSGGILCSTGDEIVAVEK